MSTYVLCVDVYDKPTSVLNLCIYTSVSFHTGKKHCYIDFEYNIADNTDNYIFFYCQW